MADQVGMQPLANSNVHSLEHVRAGASFHTNKQTLSLREHCGHTHTHTTMTKVKGVGVATEMEPSGIYLEEEWSRYGRNEEKKKNQR